MQALPGSQRPSQRRTPNPPTSTSGHSPSGAQSQYSPASAHPAMSVGAGQPGVRTNSNSSKSHTYKKSNASQQLSQIEKSVTHLLVATKQLLEMLTQWSRHNATEAEVSDVYVRLGYEFNIASRAFNAIGVDTSDLGNVPDLLRSILEDTLSQEASPASLDRYLPRIRDIIINLLHGLKRKQSKLRQRQAKEEAMAAAAAAAAVVPAGPSARHASATSLGSGDYGSGQVAEEVMGRFANGAFSPQIPRSGSGRDGHLSDDLAHPPRSSSVQNDRAPTARQESSSVGGAGAKMSTPSTSGQAVSGQKPSLPASSFSRSVTPPQHASAREDGRPPGGQLTRESASVPFIPPPPPPKQQDALAALQRGGDLERRASRRYSAYQISKHLGASTNAMPMLAPTQHSPIPNRGRDVRESLNAVRNRGSLMPNQQRSPSRRPVDASPSRQADIPPRISEDSGADSFAPTLVADAAHGCRESPILKPAATEHKPGGAAPRPHPEDVPAQVPLAELPGGPDAGARRRDDTEAVHPVGKSFPADDAPATRSAQADGPPTASDPRAIAPTPSPQPGKELTLFLQYKSRIKKFVLQDGENELSVARLQLAFIEKFAWNTHSNGIDLPDIYIQDSVSGVRHELEDLSDVRDRSVLVLNVETLDEVKRHIDEKVADLGKMVEEVRTVIESQHSSIQRVSERQTDAAKDLARLAAGPVAAPKRMSVVEVPTSRNAPPAPVSVDKANQLNDVRSLRRDLAVVRQTYSSFVEDIQASMSDIRTRAGSVKSVAINARTPTLDSQTGRTYVNKGKKDLGEVSDGLVNRVDDLQDLVEDLRKDVVTRGVRPLPRQLESVGREIASATTELKKVQEFLRREKPKWSKIWEKELQVVCDDRDLLTMQEALAADLQDDLESAAQTFSLVEEATKEQMKDGSGTTSRSASRTLNNDPTIDPQVAKAGVLGEVRALQPNHENRVEAIERAEKARQRELESRRGGQFQKELGNFVEEGRLKKSGGVEETERQRRARDERIRREIWERESANARAKEAVRSVTPRAEKDEVTAAASEAYATPLGGSPPGYGGKPKTLQPVHAEDDGDEPRKDAPKQSSWLPAIFGSGSSNGS
ncbi:MAG: Bud site selection protein 6 [Lichina confinis]|nr:MAG: Bud site selection protein 6 [Lichina confinis]